MPPRLGLLLPHVTLGGGETAMMEVAEGLTDHFQISVAALDPHGGTESDEDGSTWTVREELQHRFDDVTFLRHRWELRPWLGRVDVLLWYGVVPQVSRALLALERRPHSIRVVHTDRAVDGEGFHQRWHGAIDATVCVHPGVARKIPGAVFIPNAVSEAHLGGSADSFFTPDSGRKTLGFLGRLVPLKNVPWLVDHVEMLGCNLLLQALDTELLTVRELEEQAQRLSLEHPWLSQRIRFLRPGRDVGTLLRSVDALVVASRHEGLPMVVLEAGFVGTPVVATPVGALPELFSEEILFVDQGEDGLPVASSMKEALARVVPSRGERLRRKVQSLCSRAAVVERYLELIRSLLGRRESY